MTSWPTGALRTHAGVAGFAAVQGAMAKLEADDAMRQHIDFTLTDLQGKSWTLKDLHGKLCW